LFVAKGIIFGGYFLVDKLGKNKILELAKNGVNLGVKSGERV